MSTEADRQRLDRLAALFDAALAQPTGTRGAFLDRECADEPTLRAELDELLDADRAANGFLDEPAEIPTEGVTWPTDEAVRDIPRIDRYDVLHRLGEGGMSTVYLASRADDSFRRQVVVKVVRRGMESPESLERLRLERQVLATLDHPNIARLFDGGTTEDGLPYFVMEHVDGVPVDVHCDRHRLDIERRLALFRDICAAVEHAHRNLVVHRDLKPSNILVDRAGRPKLLDFGIAKLLHPALLGETATETAPWLRLLTPSYASPEQIQGQTITTASDVYALGVLLYQLLTGRLPHRLRDGDSPADFVRHVMTEPPPRPSVAVEPRGSGDADGDDLAATAAARALRHAGALRRRLVGDLDSIVMKCLRTEPRHRYASAARLAEDLERHRRGRPVLARRGTWRYRAQKLVRRHPVTCAVGVTALLLIAGFVLALARQVEDSARQRDRARFERNVRDQVLGLMTDMLRGADPFSWSGEDTTVAHLLDANRPRLSDRLPHAPEVRAALLVVFGEVYTSLGRFGEAERALLEARRLRIDSFGPASREVAETWRALAAVDRQRGELTRAEHRARESLALVEEATAVPQETRAAAFNELVAVLCWRDEFRAADALADRALEAAERASPALTPLVDALTNRAMIDTALGRHTAAARGYRHALSLVEPIVGADHASLATAVNNLGSALRRSGDLDGAIQAFERAVSLVASAAPDHPRLAAPLSNLAGALERQGRLEEAEDHYRRAAGLLKRVDPTHPRATLLTLQAQATRIDRGGAAAVAVASARVAEQLRRQVGPEHMTTILAEGLEGRALLTLGRLDEAETALVSVFERLLEVGKAHQREDALRQLDALFRLRGTPERLATFAEQLDREDP